MIEQVDRRILGALRIVDATTRLPVAESVLVTAEGARLARNRRGDYLILGAPGFDAYVETFDLTPGQPPGQPALGSLRVQFEVYVPSGAYLPRRGEVRLPRDPDPDHATQADSLFRPAILDLYPAPSARTAMSWAVVRATVRDQASRDRLPWALLRILAAGGDELIADGVADQRGEALLAVPGIPTSMPADDNGAVLTTEIDVRLEVVFDDPVVERITDRDLDVPSQLPNRDYLPDLDALRTRSGLDATLVPRGEANPVNTASLAAGREVIVDVLVVLP